MKKLLLTAFILFTISSLFAQINKGQYMVGGNISFDISNGGFGNDLNVQNFKAAPNVGYFFIDKLAAGLDISLDSRRNRSNGYTHSKSFGYTISPFVRYYALPASSRFNVFAEATYGLGETTGKSDYYGKNKSKNQSYSFSAGPVYFVTPNIGIEFNVGYYNTSYKDNGPGKVVYKGIQTGLGLQIHLGNRKKQ